MVYDDFDIWNSDTKRIVEVPQVEKRVRYFHILFIPIFPVAVQWTIRNKNGIHKVNTICEEKIKAVFSKSYGPWYSFLAPILALVFITSYMAFTFVEKKIRQQNNSEKIRMTRSSLLKQLDTIPTPFYIVLDAPFKSGSSFHGVDAN